MANTTVGIVFEVRKKGDAALSSLNRDVTTIGRTLKGLAVTTLGLAGIGSIGYALTKAAEGIDRIAKTSDRLGTTTESLSALEYSASLAGIEADGLASAMERMSKGAAEAARGTGEARYAFAALGLDARALATMDPARAIDEIADAMARVPEQSERLRLTYAIFGRGQGEMVNLLQGGSSALAAQREEADRLGLSFSRIDAAKVEEANDALTRAKAVITAGLRVAVIQMAPYVEALATGLTNAAISGEGFGSKVTAAMESVALAAAKVLEIMEKIAQFGPVGKASEDLGYWVTLESAMKKDAIAEYEFQMKQENKHPWSAPLFKRRGTAMFPERYDEVLKSVEGRYMAEMAKRPPDLDTPDRVSDVEAFFSGIRARVAESQTRNEGAVAAQAATTQGIESETDGTASRLVAIDELIAKMRQERDMAGQTAKQRAETSAIESTRKAVQDDYAHGLRTTNDLTDAELKTVKDIANETARVRDQAAMDQVIASLQDENEIQSLIRHGREDEARVLEAINDLKRQGIDINDAAYAKEKAQIEDLIEAKEKFQKGYGKDVGGGISGAVGDMQAELGGLGDLAYDVARVGIDGLAESLSHAALKGEDLSESLREVGLSIADMMMQWAIKSAITGTLGGLGFGGGSAKGNVFDSTGLVRFERGTVIDRPTLFPFARGTGLMGEAGPEGILPLDRDSQGRLGVHTTESGGGKMEALLGQILGALQQRQSVNLNASIVDRRDVVTRERLESREGEQMVMYHVGRNQ